MILAGETHANTIWPPPEAVLQLKTRSAHHLTPQQIHFFDDNGYVVLRNWIPQDLLQRLQAAGQAWIDTGLQQHSDNPDDAAHGDFAFQFVNGQRTMFRVNYVHNKGQAASLELLGCPQMLAVAESMCGPNFVPTYEAMVFKQEGNGVAIDWHQDACHARNYRIFNYDLYLDASKIGAGALRVIPRSNTQRQDICQLAGQHGWDAPGAIDVEMQPGDVLLHDVMVVHGSAETHGNALRRTIYYEFRAAEEIVEDGPWDRDWIDRRLRLVPLALRRHAQAQPDTAQFQWNAREEFRPATSGDEQTELKIAHKVHMPGAYCSAGDAGRLAKKTV